MPDTTMLVIAVCVLLVTSIVGFALAFARRPAKNEGADAALAVLDGHDGAVDVQRQLLDDVRHELKTPITIVRGHLELMDPSDPADVATTRALGLAELDRMTRLVEDIDLLAEATADQLSMHDVEVRQLTERVGEMVAVMPGHTWSIESAASGLVRVDEPRLRQAWLQLADNAAKYTPQGSPIEIGSRLDDQSLTLWVRDHGPGVPYAQRARIFRRFDRAHGSRTLGGSGLGLAIVAAIAAAHGGRCTILDTPGGGATFEICVPLPHSPLPAPLRAAEVADQRRGSL